VVTRGRFGGDGAQHTALDWPLKGIASVESRLQLGRTLGAAHHAHQPAQGRDVRGSTSGTTYQPCSSISPMWSRPRFGVAMGESVVGELDRAEQDGGGQVQAGRPGVIVLRSLAQLLDVGEQFGALL
jgi:hypothetical protein